MQNLARSARFVIFGSMPTREENKQTTHQALSEAALSLFIDRGFEHTTAEDIADAAGVSRRTLFRYFADKQACAFPRSAHRLAMLKAHLDVEGPSLQQVEEGVAKLAEAFMHTRSFELRQQRIVDRTPALQQRELALFADWEAVITARLLRDWPQGAGRIAGAAILAMIRVQYRRWVDGGCSADLVEMSTDGFALLRAGLNQGVDDDLLFSSSQ